MSTMAPVSYRCYNPDDPVSGYGGIPRNITVFVTKLQSAGYSTYQVGKWHVGSAATDHILTSRGFDTYFISFRSLFAYKFVQLITTGHKLDQLSTHPIACFTV